MKICMIGVGLVNGVDGSFYFLNMVLELEVVFFYCYKVMSQYIFEVGDKLLVVDIGGGIFDIVVQEVVFFFLSYRVKEVMMSLGGLCGGIYVDVCFM